MANPNGLGHFHRGEVVSFLAGATDNLGLDVFTRDEPYAGEGSVAAAQVARPVSTSAAGAWTAQPSGTLWGVTSDDTNSTYAQLLDGDDPSTMTLTIGTLANPEEGNGSVIIRARKI